MKYCARKGKKKSPPKPLSGEKVSEERVNPAEREEKPPYNNDKKRSFFQQRSYVRKKFSWV